MRLLYLACSVFSFTHRQLLVLESRKNTYWVSFGVNEPNATAKDMDQSILLNPPHKK